MNATQEKPKYLTVSEVAALLRLSVSATRRLLVSGKLQGRRRGEGGHWLVREDWVEAYLDAGTSAPQGMAAAKAGDAVAAKKLRAIGYDV